MITKTATYTRQSIIRNQHIRSSRAYTEFNWLNKVNDGADHVCVGGSYQDSSITHV